METSSVLSRNTKKAKEQRVKEFGKAQPTQGSDFVLFGTGTLGKILDSAMSSLHSRYGKHLWPQVGNGSEQSKEECRSFSRPVA